MTSFPFDLAFWNKRCEEFLSESAHGQSLMLAESEGDAMTKEIVARLEALLGNAEAALTDGVVGTKRVAYAQCQGRIAALKDAIAVVKEAPPCACGGRVPLKEWKDIFRRYPGGATSLIGSRWKSKPSDVLVDVIVVERQEIGCPSWTQKGGWGQRDK